jgi:hypothetical protein
MPPLDVTLESLINGLDSELVEADALTKVSEARQRARGLAELGDQLVDHYVAAARAGGASWSQIGDAMGVSKQAAQQRKGGANFDRFTDRARKAVVHAQEQARAAGSRTIELAHVLLGVLDEPEGIGAKVVAMIAGPEPAARDAITATLPPKGEPVSSGHIPFSPACKKTLGEVFGIAVELDHNYVGTEHLLLGALRSTDDPAVQALGQLGVTGERAREAVTAALMGFQHRDARD